MTKKSKITSTESMHSVLASSGREIAPPEYLGLVDADMPFFDAVITEFAKNDWSDHEIQLAGMLARAMSGLVEEQNLLREEGSISMTEKGTPVANPRKTLIQMYSGTILSMRKSLALDARAGGEKGRDIAKRKNTTKDIESKAQLAMGSRLIARPTAH